MLRAIQDLHNYAVGAIDGSIGEVKDFYFDDQGWAVRYLVIDTGSWLSSRKVLISPMAFGKPDWALRLLPVALTKAQVSDSPAIDTEQPVSRQHERTLLGYYGYPNYWSDADPSGRALYPDPSLPNYKSFGPMMAARSAVDSAHVQAEEARLRGDDLHLRSCAEVTGYHIMATDGEIGNVQGFLVDDETWVLRYLIVNTSNWWLGHEMLVAPAWIEGVSWPDKTVSVNMSQQSVMAAPPYDPALPLSRAREIELYRHHGHTGYWPLTERTDDQPVESMPALL